MKFDLKAWLIEFFNRFAEKTPKFFQVWQTIGVVLALIAGLPELLFQVKEFLGIDVWSWLPDPVKFIANKTVAIAGLVMLMMAKLPVKNSTTVINTTDKLPFTEKQQQ